MAKAVNKTMRFGVATLQDSSWPSMVERWQYVENLGFDSVWIADHFVNPDHPNQPWYEGWTTLAGLAPFTRKIRIGVLVSSIVMRHPALLAREALTLDHISNGRLELGIGSGGAENDHSMLGIGPWDTNERTRRFRESIEIVDLLLRNSITSYEGSFYKIRDAIMNPPPIQRPRPPLTIAAHGPTTLKIAAAYANVWNSFGGYEMPDREAVKLTRERSELLDSYCQSIGRDPSEIERSFLMGFTTDRPFESVDAFQDFVCRYREAGISNFIFYWKSENSLSAAGVTERSFLERIALEELPKLRGM